VKIRAVEVTLSFTLQMIFRPLLSQRYHRFELKQRQVNIHKNLLSRRAFREKIGASGRGGG
jgi:hypothetical protein